MIKQLKAEFYFGWPTNTLLKPSEIRGSAGPLLYVHMRLNNGHEHDLSQCRKIRARRQPAVSA